MQTTTQVFADTDLNVVTELTIDFGRSSIATEDPIAVTRMFSSFSAALRKSKVSHTPHATLRPMRAVRNPLHLTCLRNYRGSVAGYIDEVKGFRRGIDAFCDGSGRRIVRVRSMLSRADARRLVRLGVLNRPWCYHEARIHCLLGPDRVADLFLARIHGACGIGRELTTSECEPVGNLQLWTIVCRSHGEDMNVLEADADDFAAKALRSLPVEGTRVEHTYAMVDNAESYDAGWF